MKRVAITSSKLFTNYSTRHLSSTPILHQRYEYNQGRSFSSTASYGSFAAITAVGVCYFYHKKKSLSAEEHVKIKDVSILDKAGSRQCI